ncbi:efflux RND transporter periplasmic adaptor subunit [Flavobacteriaceae bacterium A100]|uniref:efflux RND transporter periplasmic adaptor subunit n=1 Tax=Oceanihabitans sediminis TaxID=1812012 RepID=UPI00092FFF97
MKQLYILLFPLLVLACGNSEKTEETTTKEETHSDELVISKAQFEGEKMAFGNLAEYDFNESVKVNGMIDVPPENKSSISTFIGGYVTKTPLLIGDKVKKGQLLVSLENTEFVEIQQSYLELAEQLNYLKSEFDRQKTLFEEQITSQKNYLKAESAYKSSLANYNGLRKKLQMMHINPKNVEQGNFTSNINIYAPIDGFVTKMNVSNGTYVSPSDMILEIVDTEHIHLELSVFEKDIMKIKKDQKILFQIPEVSNKTYTASVHLVGTTIDEKTRRVRVHGHVDNEEDNFIVGMFVEAEIITNQTKGVGLPKSAIIEVEDHAFALILEEQNNTEYHVEKIALNLGKQTEDYVEILNAEALKNKQIIVKGTSMLLNDSEGGHSH